MTVRTRADSGIRTLTIARSNAANAFDLALALELETAFADAIADPHCRLIVLTAEGRFFTAGGDVKAMLAADDIPTYIAELAASLHRSVLIMATAEIPTLAVVTGPAAGAGLGLVLNADLVIGTPAASLVAAYGAVGLTPDCGVSYLLPRRVGGARAASMLLAGRALNAQEGLAWGLLGEIVEEDQLQLAVDRTAAGVLAQTRGSVAETLRLSRDATLDGYEAHLAEEASTIVAMSSQRETVASLAAFAARSAQGRARSE